ncbi:21038_t:CDS:2, partial [Dentiscutata erythropus]
EGQSLQEILNFIKTYDNAINGTQDLLIEVLQQRKASLTTENERLRKLNGGSVDQLCHEIVTSIAQINELKGNIVALGNQIETKNSEITSLKDQIYRMTQENCNFRETLGKLKSQATDLFKDL